MKKLFLMAIAAMFCISIGYAENKPVQEVKFLNNIQIDNVNDYKLYIRNASQCTKDGTTCQNIDVYKNSENGELYVEREYHNYIHLSESNEVTGYNYKYYYAGKWYFVSI